MRTRKKRPACDACHRRKIQCDHSGAEGQCDWCRHHDLECTYARVRGRKNASVRSKEASRASSTAVESPQGAGLVPISSPLSNGGSVTAYDRYQPAFDAEMSRGSVADVSSIYVSGDLIGQINSCNGIPFLSPDGQQWVQSRTGQSCEKLQALVSQPAIFNTSDAGPSLSPIVLQQLPERRLVEMLFHEFTTSSFWLMFPFVDQHLFHDTIRLAYEAGSHPPSMEMISARACVFAFLSISLFIHEGPELPGADTDAYACTAQHLLSQTSEVLGIAPLQTMLMLILHQMTAGRWQSASMMHAMACRIMFALGGHSIATGRAFQEHGQPRQRSHIRRLFWLCYTFDVDIALRIGPAPIMSDEFCDLTLPDGYQDNFARIMAMNRVPVRADIVTDKLEPTFPGDLRLSILKAKVLRRLYSAQALRKSDTALLCDVRELDDELESWRLSLPPELRPALSIRAGSTHVSVGAKTTPQNMQHIILHLEYHHLLTSIHRATGRCYSSGLEDNVRGFSKAAGVGSSLALSVEASRSTLIYLQAAGRGLPGEVFWVVISYVMTAQMALFANILADPLDDQAQQDLMLLGSTATLFRSLPVQTLSRCEVTHWQLMDRFVAELVRLGGCAVNKARSGAGDMEM